MVAAELPATMVASKELTPTWMKRLAMAKMAFCSPPGRPMRKMALERLRLRRSSRSRRP